MKTGIMQTGLCHPERLDRSWDWFTGWALTYEEESNLCKEGWICWCWDEEGNKSLWIRPTPAPEVPELVADEGGPDD